MRVLSNINWNTWTVGLASEVQFRNKLPPAKNDSIIPVRCHSCTSRQVCKINIVRYSRGQPQGLIGGTIVCYITPTKETTSYKKVIKLYCHHYIILLFACYSADTCNENSAVHLLTKYIQVTCTDRTMANSIPCMALINPRMTAMYIQQNKRIIATKNNSCILPYPCDVRRRITSSITLKVYATAFSYWAWTM